MSLHHGCGWQLPWTASHIHIRHLQSVWTHSYAVHRHTVAALHSYTHPIWPRFWAIWVTCWVKIMPLHHGWGWQPPQTASHIHIRNINCVWAHAYAVHRHTISALVYTYTHASLEYPTMPPAGFLKVFCAPARQVGIWRTSKTKIYNLETGEFSSNLPFSKINLVGVISQPTFWREQLELI